MRPSRSLTNLLAILVILFASGIQAASTLPDEVNLRGIPGPYSFGKFCRLRTSELWAVGGDGTVQFRSAAGSVERRVTNEDLNGVYLPNNGIGWVVGDGGSILRTTDQGHSWSRQSSGVKQSLKSIKCTTESRCWVVGEAGVILSTRDAGEHWDNKKSVL